MLRQDTCYIRSKNYRKLKAETLMLIDALYAQNENCISRVRRCLFSQLGP